MFQLFLLEKRTVLKGWLLCFVIIFPFTFIPVISGEGAFWDRVIERIPDSLGYTVVYSAVLCLAALYHNYQRQKIKIDYFNKEAFKKLDFIHIPRGRGSLVHDLGFYLVGFHDGIKYAIDMEIELEDHEKRHLIVKPVIEAETEEEQRKMIKEYTDLLSRDFKVNNFGTHFAIVIDPQEINFDDPLGVTKTLNLIGSKLKLKVV